MARPYTLKPRGKKGILWLRFTDPNGKPVQRSSGTTDRDLASEWASREHAQAYRVARLGDKPRRLWRDAVDRWLGDHSTKRSLGKDEHNIAWLDPHFGSLHLDEIDADRLAVVKAARMAQPRDKRNGAPTDGPLTSEATADKMLALVRSVLRDAAEWGWIDRAPKIRLAKQNDDDYRWLTRDEAKALHAELAPHLRPLFEFALATGWREQNVLRLEWKRVDLQRKVAWVLGSQAKGKRPIGAPLNTDALGILRAQEGKHPRWVFPNPETGKPYARANNTGWNAAQARAGLEPVTWHELRHTWASWHVMAGTSLRALMDLGGWRSYKSVLRYAHLSPEHLAADAARVEGLARDLHGHTAPNPRKTATKAGKSKPAGNRRTPRK